jgi:thiamine biosynthesis lipoprotein
MVRYFLQINLVIGLLATSHTCISAQELKRFEFHSYEMGTDFRLTLYASNDSIAEAAAQASWNEVRRLNQIFSDYSTESEISRLSHESQPHRWLSVSDDLFMVLKQARKISRQSNGLFDVTIGPMTKLWRAIRQASEPKLPSDSIVQMLDQKVGYGFVLLKEPSQIQFTRSKIEFDFGGIAKGYAAERMLHSLSGYGIQRAMINAGGDVTVGDPPPGKYHWEIVVPWIGERGISDVQRFKIQNVTVATSGSIHQSILIDGDRYSHIIDPRTGIGSTKQIQATVISSTGMLADAYATILTILNPTEGIRMIESLPDLEAFIYYKKEDRVHMVTSSGLQSYQRD